IVWGYPNAFRIPEDGKRPNSVGLRTAERGTVKSASLTLRFERDWILEPFRTVERPPQLYVADVPDLPGNILPEEFFHNPRRWKRMPDLTPARSGMMAEVYHWSSSPFHGMAKAVWTPHANYFCASKQARQSLTSETMRPRL